MAFQSPSNAAVGAGHSSAPLPAGSVPKATRTRRGGVGRSGKQNVATSQQATKLQVQHSQHQQQQQFDQQQPPQQPEPEPRLEPVLSQEYLDWCNLQSQLQLQPWLYPFGQADMKFGLPANRQETLVYQKQVVKQMLDFLDNDSLWRLVVEMVQCGHMSKDILERWKLPRSIDSIGHPGGACAHVPDSIGQAMAVQAAAAAAPPPQQGKQMRVSLETALAPDAKRSPSAQAAMEFLIPARSQAAAPKPNSLEVLPAKGQELREDEKGFPDSGGTSLILRNLPSHFDQKQCEEWVDINYKGRYDFLLWFPAKKISRLNNCSYAFANFRTVSDAKRFKQDFHLVHFNDAILRARRTDEDKQWPLSIAVAKIQGFAANYIRFRHFLDETCNTLCSPYFAPDAVASLSKEQLEAAAAQADKALVARDHSEALVTVIIRNLPESLEGQDMARSWFNGAGFGGQYNFFLYLPAKQRKPDSQTPEGGPGQGFAYAFVNFLNEEKAKACIEQLHNMSTSKGDPKLNVVPARVQGYNECLEHFRSLGESGRIEPWRMPPAEAAVGRFSGDGTSNTYQ